MKERRTLPEQIGVDLSSSRLRIEAAEPGVETALLRLAGLGAAILHVRHGADRAGPRGRGGPVAEQLADDEHEIREIDAVAAELAGMMFHIRYGGQHALLPRAIVLFAGYMRMRRRMIDAVAQLPARARAAFLPRFAALVMHESLSDRCGPCGGSGKLERSELGAWIKPRGVMKRNALFRTCTHCNGSRRPLPSHTARRKALGLTFDEYERGQWATHFRAARTWLEVTITRRLNRPLTIQLERVKRRP